MVTADVLHDAHILILHTVSASGGSTCVWSLSSSGLFLLPQGRDFPWSSCSRAFCWLSVENPDQSIHAPVCCVDLLLNCLNHQVCCRKTTPHLSPSIRICSACLYGRSGLSRFPSWCLGLQHRHDPHRPSRLWSVSVQYPRIECFRYCKCTDH